MDMRTGRGGPRRLARSRRGFTLLELIVVITIIGILGTLVVVRVSGYTGRARTEKIKADLKAIIHAAELFEASQGRVPQTLEELKSGKDQDGKDVGFTLGATKDPWNNEYIYEITNGKPHVRCLGADGRKGGDGENQDFEESSPEGE